MMDGWQNMLKVSFIADPIKKLLDEKGDLAVVSRSEINCNDAVLGQLIEYGFIAPRSDDTPESYTLAITRDEFETALGIKESQTFLKGVEVLSEDVDEFTRVLQNNDALNHFSRLIAPKIKKMDACKVAILIALASGWDDQDYRFRVHVLMHGKDSSGTGKTPILKWLQRIGSKYIDATFATRAGITVDLRDGSPGILAKYHHGVCTTDELDKMPKKDRDGILSALEDGSVPYLSGNVEGEYPAEIIGIAGANSIDHFTPEQLNRFDFRFWIGQYTEDEACEITDSISTNIGKATPDSAVRLAKFLKWIRAREASIPDEVRAPGAEEIKRYIRQSGNTDIRRIESIWRVSIAIARLNYRDVSFRDVKLAIRLLDDADKKNIEKEVE